MRLTSKLAFMILVGVIATLALAGCAPIQPGASTDTQAGAPPSSEVSGTITVPDGETIPAEAQVVVEIVDLTAWTPVVSVTYTPTVEGFPLSFNLTSDELIAEGAYGVTARILIEGKPTYLIMEPVKIKVGASMIVELTLASNAELTAPFAGTISGTLTKLDDEALPAGTGVVVDLLDLTTLTPVATDTYTTTGEQVPLPFTIEVAAEDVSANGFYGLAARLMIDGRPMYVTMEPTPLHSGAPMEGIELMLTNNSEMLAPEGSAAESAVTGSVTYRERIALPAGAVITVRLQDTSLADAPALLVSEQVITTTGEQVPIAYSLPYDPALIDERNTYSVSARIEIDGKLTWISDTAVLVITHGNPTSDVQVTLVKV